MCTWHLVDESYSAGSRTMDDAPIEELLGNEESFDCEDAARSLRITQDSYLHSVRHRFILRLAAGLVLLLLAAAGVVAVAVKAEPELGGAVVLRSPDTAPLLGLAHVSPAAVDVLCVIDISQMVARINVQGLLIPVAEQVCDFSTQRKQGIRVTRLDRERCASFILLNIINADLFIGALADSLTQCSASLNVPANCAANILSIVGTTTLIAQSAVQMDYQCVDHEWNVSKKVQQKKAEWKRIKQDLQRDVQKFLEDQGLNVENKLPPDPAVPKSVVYRSIAGCFGSITLSVTFIMRLAIILADAIIHCPNNGGSQPKICALDLLGVLGLMSASVRFIATSVLTCASVIGESNDGSACAQAASALPTGVFSAAAVFGNVEAACSLAFAKWNPENWPAERTVRTAEEEEEDGDLIIPDV